MGLLRFLQEPQFLVFRHIASNPRGAQKEIPNSTFFTRRRREDCCVISFPVDGEKPGFQNALPERSHPMHCSPEVSGRSQRLQSNNAKDGTSAARDPFPCALQGCDASASLCVICGCFDCDGCDGKFEIRNSSFGGELRSQFLFPVS